MTIYTAIFGDYDDLKEPQVITPGWEYVCFTDQPFTSDIWQIVKIEKSENPVLAARSIKIKSRLGGIWVDGSFVINCNLNQFWEDHYISPLTVIRHPIRNCLYDEAMACIKNKRGDYFRVKGQVDYYYSLGMPKLWGLIQSGILLRENTVAVNNFCDLWFQQLTLSTRDQIGFSFAEWKTGFRWPRVEGFDYRTSQEFIFRTHKNRRDVKAH